VSTTRGPISYEASGTATGPYAGTFTETGTVTVGVEEPPTGLQRVTSAGDRYQDLRPSRWEWLGSTRRIAQLG
jgi:hypothetical protein